MHARAAAEGNGEGDDVARRPARLLELMALLALALVATSGGAVAVEIPDMSGCGVPPAICPNVNVTFWLYTRAEPEPQLLKAETSSLQKVRFANGTFKIIIHGYTGDRNYSPNTEIRPAYLERADYNVISVDWGPLAREPCYMHATYTVATVGNCTAQLLDALVAAGVAALPALHVVGFSLGAQVAAQVGLFLRSGKLPRVTGLDPALPLFASAYKESKLDASDADFVDVIHTNAGNKGKYEPCGDIDFYVNGGFNQPGCATHPDGEPSCSHARAPAYFGESINSNVGFYGRSCCSWYQKVVGWCSDENADTVLMGEYTPHSAQGTYYVNTQENPPYALGKEDNACSN